MSDINDAYGLNLNPFFELVCHGTMNEGQKIKALTKIFNGCASEEEFQARLEAYSAFRQQLHQERKAANPQFKQDIQKFPEAPTQEDVEELTAENTTETMLKIERSCHQRQVIVDEFAAATNSFLGIFNILLAAEMKIPNLPSEILHDTDMTVASLEADRKSVFELITKANLSMAQAESTLLKLKIK